MKMLVWGLVIVLLVVPGAMVYKNLNTPDNLGLQNGRLAPLASSPNGVSSFAEEADKKVAALPFKADLKATQLAALRAFAHMPNNKVISRNGEYVHVVFFSPTVGYRDDVELLFDEANQQLHFRSQSRVGYSDMGINKQRYQEFVKLYNEAD
ncbi:DUF1499 domain-containing protein [Agarivorans sp. MS3-6]|uniref:DUF1499 domain-containing protein n=1 Tax=Agarivorans sp. TSD2052 TaxID=2937286 RepID=UPI0020104062|nr:DUF1499 domain-containing protein [Agarivorans sp. TSD2052]UPW19620.1 DUF1499 domain-containing protein [Agarivorans sp. TSD2052]